MSVTLRLFLSLIDSYLHGLMYVSDDLGVPSICLRAAHDAALINGEMTSNADWSDPSNLISQKTVLFLDLSKTLP